MKPHRMLRFGVLAAASLAGLLPASADMFLKDGNGNIQSVCTTIFGTPSKHAYCHTLVDINGVAFGTIANPFHVTLDGASLTIGTLPALAAGTNTIGSIANITGVVSLPTGAAKESGGNLDALNAKLPVLGQKAKAGSVGVSLPVDPDILSAAATITTTDAASTTTAGQNGLPVITGTPTAGSVYSIAVNGQSEAGFTVSGTFVGTLQFEGSANGGLTWTPRFAYIMGTKFRQTQITGPGIFHINSADLTNIRVRVVALTSGAPSVQLNTTTGTGSVYVMNDVELVDNTTGLSPTVKQVGAATTSDSALTVQNPLEAAALGTPADVQFNGTNTASQIALLKAAVANLAAIVNQAAPTSLPGTSIASTLGVPGFQGVTGGVALNVVQQNLPAFAQTPLVNLGIGGTALTLGQKTMAASLPVALASDQVVSVDTVVKGTSADVGGTIAAGGTAQQFMAANASRRGWHLENQSTGPLYVNCVTTATLDYHSLLIAAGAFFTTDAQFVGTGACSIIGATTGQAFYGRQF